MRAEATRQILAPLAIEPAQIPREGFRDYLKGEEQAGAPPFVIGSAPRLRNAGWPCGRAGAPAGTAQNGRAFSTAKPRAREADLQDVTLDPHPITQASHALHRQGPGRGQPRNRAAAGGLDRLQAPLPGPRWPRRGHRQCGHLAQRGAVLRHALSPSSSTTARPSTRCGLDRPDPAPRDRLALRLEIRPPRHAHRARPEQRDGWRTS